METHTDEATPERHLSPSQTPNTVPQTRPQSRPNTTLRVPQFRQRPRLSGKPEIVRGGEEAERGSIREIRRRAGHGLTGGLGAGGSEYLQMDRVGSGAI